MNDIAFEAMRTKPQVDNKKLKRKVGYASEPGSAEDTVQALKKMRLEEEGKIGNNQNSSTSEMQL